MKRKSQTEAEILESASRVDWTDVDSDSRRAFERIRQNRETTDFAGRTMDEPGDVRDSSGEAFGR